MQKMMLLCVVSSQEFPKLMEILEKSDPDAFVIVSEAREVYVEEFKN